MPEKPKKIAQSIQNRRTEDNCAFLRFWQRWGPHLDLVGGITCLSMLATIIWAGFNFVHDTQALAPQVSAQHQQIQLVTARTDRMGNNIELIMRALHIRPLPKTDTERQLEEEQTQ